MGSRRHARPVLTGTPLARLFSKIDAVEEVIDPGTKFPPMRVSPFTILLTTGGNARVRVGSQLVSHRTGTIVFLAQGADIQESAGKRNPWLVRYIMLRGPWARMMTR